MGLPFKYSQLEKTSVSFQLEVLQKSNHPRYLEQTLQTKESLNFDMCLPTLLVQVQQS